MPSSQNLILLLFFIFSKKVLRSLRKCWNVCCFLVRSNEGYGWFRDLVIRTLLLSDVLVKILNAARVRY